MKVSNTSDKHIEENMNIRENINSEQDKNINDNFNCDECEDNDNENDEKCTTCRLNKAKDMTYNNG